MSRRLLLTCAALAVCLAVLSCPAAAQTGGARLEAEINIDDEIQQIAAQEREAVKKLLEDLDAAPSLRPDHVPGFEDLSQEAQETLQVLLSGNAALFERRLGEFASQQAKRLQDIGRHWAQVRMELDGSALRAEDRKRRLLAEQQGMSRAGFRHGALWAAIALAFGALLGCAAYLRRHALRRLRYGARSRKLGLSRYVGALAVVVIAGIVVAVLLGDPLSALVNSEGLRPSTDAPPTRGAPAPSRALTESQATEESQASEETGWSESRLLAIRSQLEDALVDMQVADKVSQAVAAEAGQLEAQAAQIAALDQQIAEERRFNQWIALGMGWGVIALVGIGAGLLVSGVRRKSRIVAETCPLCLAVGTLEHEPLPQGTAKQFQKLVCRNVISTDPPEDCNFNFYSYYQPMTKLCFPTLGHPRAGKTHWLAMVYRELNRGNFTEQVEFEAIKSESSEDFERVVDEILESRMDPERTQTATIPRPLLFNFRDRDRVGKSSVLISMFDYSGEVVASMTLDDSQRRRALEADGYLFFLDPMEIAEPQAKELVRFREDVRIVKGIGAGEKIHAPVALCVPKIDLLVNHPTAGQDRAMIERFYEELARIDPTGQEISLDVIEARSKLIAPMCGALWPGWQVERQIRSLFGGRYMFFPLTPVGLAEPGEIDLRNRTIEPFGILEPLLWLLQMNGYPVLD